jgi:hypothetical protein
MGAGENQAYWQEGNQARAGSSSKDWRNRSLREEDVTQDFWVIIAEAAFPNLTPQRLHIYSPISDSASQPRQVHF